MVIFQFHHDGLNEFDTHEKIMINILIVTAKNNLQSFFKCFNEYYKCLKGININYFMRSFPRRVVVNSLDRVFNWIDYQFLLYDVDKLPKKRLVALELNNIQQTSISLHTYKEFQLGQLHGWILSKLWSSLGAIDLKVCSICWYFSHQDWWKVIVDSHFVRKLKFTNVKKSQSLKIIIFTQKESKTFEYHSCWSTVIMRTELS